MCLGIAMRFCEQGTISIGARRCAGAAVVTVGVKRQPKLHVINVWHSGPDSTVRNNLMRQRTNDDVTAMTRTSSAPMTHSPR
jgi:hypothetical protein